MNKIITISRSFSSGGREIAKRLADELNLAYYDNELIEEIAKKTGFAEDYIKQYSEATFTRAYPIQMARSFSLVHEMPSDTIQIAQANIIKEFGEKGDCVFVGRRADYILKELNPLKVFIYSSDMEQRIKRCYEKVPADRQKTEKEMKKQILTIDKQRAKFYSFYTDQRWGDMQNYNLCIDTSVISTKQAVKLIIMALNGED